MPRRNANARCLGCPNPLPVRLIAQLNPLGVDDDERRADLHAIEALRAEMHAEDMAGIRHLLG